MKTPILILLSLVLSGCSVIPQTYAQYQREQRERARCVAAGVEYKGPHALKAEVLEMRELHAKYFP